MLSTTEHTVCNAMESVTGQGCLERVKKMRDFAFVHFTNRESAKAAMEYWNSKLHAVEVASVPHFDLCFVRVTYNIWNIGTVSCIL
jgi:RNA recognition motif-containing protein